MPPPRQTVLFPDRGKPARAALYAEVAVPLPVRAAFSYAVPESLAARTEPGVRVAVPFGRQQLVGFVIAVSHSAPPGVDASAIREVRSVLDPEPVFPLELLRFLREAAEYYVHPLGEVLRAAAPAVDARVRPEQQAGAMRARWARVREETFVRLSAQAIAALPELRGPKQKQLAAILEERGEVSLSELRAQMDSARTVVETLRKRGLVDLDEREVPADPFFGDSVPRDVPPVLTDAQRDAVASIDAAIVGQRRATFLLHGITGSGKTEVYLRAVDAVQKLGRGALILLPEIALTPQLVGRYRARFGDNLAVLHSGLKGNERFAMWRRLRAGECRVAIGARSAIFAPVHNLGLVIVDEEHDSSFKQDEQFRYHGRDLALLRAHRADVVCVLGSATPSVESYHAGLEGRFELLSLPHRATAATLPEVDVVDMRKLGRRGPTGVEQLSLPLVRALGETLGRNEQAIVFLNRRGFAPSIHCAQCERILECPACSVALVLHRREGALKCHYCDFRAPFAGACVRCSSPEITLLGIGTEKLEGALVDAFPGARIGRLDRDVASGIGAESVLGRLRRGEIDVLVGTQMVTKGHDVPRVTLVGVIAADTALSLPDFRASERTFQLLAQVAGRAGRAQFPGRVIIQTYQPEHAAIRHARAHDYAGFYAEEIAARRELGYPPFGRLAAIRVDALDEERARRVAEQLAERIRSLPELRDRDVTLLGPAAAPLAKVRARYRQQMLLRARERPPLRRVLSRLAGDLEEHAPHGARVAIDVDPVQML